MRAFPPLCYLCLLLALRSYFFLRSKEILVLGACWSNASPCRSFSALPVESLFFQIYFDGPIPSGRRFLCVSLFPSRQVERFWFLFLRQEGFFFFPPPKNLSFFSLPTRPGVASPYNPVTLFTIALCKWRLSSFPFSCPLRISFSPLSPRGKSCGFFFFFMVLKSHQAPGWNFFVLFFSPSSMRTPFPPPKKKKPPPLSSTLYCSRDF